jgi:hypothetical protein
VLVPHVEEQLPGDAALYQQGKSLVDLRQRQHPVNPHPEAPVGEGRKRLREPGEALVGGQPAATVADDALPATVKPGQVYQGLGARARPEAHQRPARGQDR